MKGWVLVIRTSCVEPSSNVCIHLLSKVGKMRSSSFRGDRRGRRERRMLVLGSWGRGLQALGSEMVEKGWGGSHDCEGGRIIKGGIVYMVGCKR